MTDLGLARASDIAVWVSMGVLTLAMLAFAAHLFIAASRAPRMVRQGTGLARKSAEPLVLAGGGGVTAPTGEEDSTPPAQEQPPARRPTRRWGVLGSQLTWAAAFVLIAGLVLRGLSVGRPPLGNMYEFALMAAMFTLVIYSVWSLRRERLWLGFFVTAFVLVTLGFAMVSWYTEATQLVPALNDLWLSIHVTVATLTVGLFTIGCAVAVLYLLRDRAEQRGQVRGWLTALPRATALERTAYGVHVVAFPLWTFTVMAGAIWAEHAWGRYWGWDSKEVWSFVIWVVYAAYLHAHATAGWSLRKATWIAVAGFACVVLNFTVVNIFFVGLHSYSGT